MSGPVRNSPKGRTGPFGWMVRIVIAGLVVSGLWMFGNGLWIFAKAELAQVLLDRSFNLSVASGELAKPWSWADMQPLGKLNSPRLGKSSIVLSAASGQALAFGPGHLMSTPLPGERGTSVLAGHRDTHFSWIRDLQPGDEISLAMIDGSTKNFTIRRSWIAPYDQSGIDADSDETLIALTTCYPFDAVERGDERYIVEAKLVDG